MTNVRMKYLSIISLILISKVLSDCGFESCAKTDPKKLNIHIISHSHDDVGWLKTVDGYYEQDVKHVITNVVESLEKNVERKFTQVEIYYFKRWWYEQNNQTQALVHKLVDSGQLGFTNGGWVVNDEGSAHYSGIIDQMTLGLKFLDQLFGKCGLPSVSWQIDPSGASKEVASLYAQMGFDAHVTNRAILPKGEFIWRGSHDLGEKSDIFTTVLHNHYSAPKGFNFESGNDITEQNKKTKAETIVNLAKTWNTNYENTNHVLMTFGDDFQYKNSEHWFKNIDLLIKTIKELYKDVNIFYSTPYCYISTVNKLNHTFSHRDNDYFPYLLSGLYTRSGMYTSRPSLKNQERVNNNLLQVSKQLDAITRHVETEPYLDEGRNEVAILQHHDAITGTSPQITADDYVKRLLSSTNALREVVDKTYKKLLSKHSSLLPHRQIVCDTLNITECFVSENNENFVLVIYNPIGRSLSQWIRTPINSDYNYEVFDHNGIKINTTFMIPVSQSVEHLQGRKSIAKKELVFRANLLGVGFVTYFVRKTSQTFQMTEKSDEKSMQKRDTMNEMKGKGFKLSVDSVTGNIKSITLENGKQFPFKQSFKYYKSNSDDAYKFCPEGNVIDISEQSVKLESKYDNGMIHQITQTWNQWISQTIRVYEDEEYIEFDWIVGPLPVGDNIGKEVISRFETDLNNTKTFYTTANGRQMVKRTRNSNTEQCGAFNTSISRNYYPIYSKIYIKDETKGIQLTVLTDRAEGGSSLVDGQLEVMVHRRLLADHKTSIDEKGVDGKGLVVRGKHYVFFKTITESPKLYRDLSQRLFMQPLITFSPMNESVNEYKNNYQTSYSALNKELPPNVHLLTLEQWKTNQIIIRFEHFYEISDNNELSKPTEVDFENLFKPFKVLKVSETTLSAHQLLSENKRMKWNSNTQFSKSNLHDRQRRELNFKIELSPQQIRTFIITLEDNNQSLNKCDLNWKNVTVNQIPSDAIIGGHDINKSPLYICRHTQNGDTLPGKADNKMGCSVTKGGKEFVHKDEYEILIGGKHEWVPRHGGDAVPGRAFVAGNDSTGGPIYVGRCSARINSVETQFVGKIHHKFYYAYENSEHSDCSNNEVLIC